MKFEISKGHWSAAGMFLLMFLSFPLAAVHAAATSSQGSTTVLVDPLGGAGIYGILGRFISTFLGLVGAIALLAFVWGGVIYMTAADSDRVKKAQEIMKNTALGLGIIVFAYILTKAFFDIILK